MGQNAYSSSSMQQNTESIPNAIRAQLLAAGVPAWKHNRDGLLALWVMLQEVL